MKNTNVDFIEYWEKYLVNEKNKIIKEIENNYYLIVGLSFARKLVYLRNSIIYLSFFPEDEQVLNMLQKLGYSNFVMKNFISTKAVFLELGELQSSSGFYIDYSMFYSAYNEYAGLFFVKQLAFDSNINLIKIFDKEKRSIKGKKHHLNHPEFHRLMTEMSENYDKIASLNEIAPRDMYSSMKKWLNFRHKKIYKALYKELWELNDLDNSIQKEKRDFKVFFYDLLWVTPANRVLLKIINHKDILGKYNTLERFKIKKVEELFDV